MSRDSAFCFFGFAKSSQCKKLWQSGRKSLNFIRDITSWYISKISERSGISFFGIKNLYGEYHFSGNCGIICAGHIIQDVRASRLEQVRTTEAYGQLYHEKRCFYGIISSSDTWTQWMILRSELCFPRRRGNSIHDNKVVNLWKEREWQRNPS